MFVGLGVSIGSNLVRKFYAPGGAVLLEIGDILLLETGDQLLLE